RDLSESALIVDGPHLSTAFELRSQLFRQTIATLVPLALEIDRHLGAHDRLMPFPRLLRRRKEFHLFNLFAQLLDDLDETFFGVVIGALPDWRFDEPKHRRQRRFFSGDGAERNLSAQLTVGIVLVVAG